MIDHNQGVRLGPVDRAHLEQLREWRNDYRVWRWCRQNDLISDSDQVSWFDRQSRDPSTRMYIILAPYKDDMVMVGACGLTSIDWINRRAEFSLYVGPDHQKYGYGAKALSTLLTHGFKTLGLNGIWGESFDRNPAVKMFEKLGMKHEGTRREFYFREGKFIDAHLYSILASEWNT